MAEREPIFNVPAGVLAILAVLIAVHVTLSLLPEDEYIWWVLALAFIPARYSGLASQLPGGEPAMFTSFVTHMAVHADLIHLCFNALWLLAFGSVLCSRIGTIRFLAFSISGGIAGALLFLALNPGLAGAGHWSIGRRSGDDGRRHAFSFQRHRSRAGISAAQESGRNSTRSSQQRSEGPAHRVLLDRFYCH